MSLATTLLTDPMIIIETVATCLSGAYFLMVLNQTDIGQRNYGRANYGRAGSRQQIPLSSGQVSESRSRQARTVHQQITVISRKNIVSRDEAKLSPLEIGILNRLSPRVARLQKSRVRALSRRVLGMNKNLQNKKQIGSFALTA